MLPLRLARLGGQRGLRFRPGLARLPPVEPRGASHDAHAEPNDTSATKHYSACSVTSASTICTMPTATIHLADHRRRSAGLVGARSDSQIARVSTTRQKEGNARTSAAGRTARNACYPSWPKNTPMTGTHSSAADPVRMESCLRCSRSAQRADSRSSAAAYLCTRPSRPLRGMCGRWRCDGDGLPRPRSANIRDASGALRC